MSKLKNKPITLSLAIKAAKQGNGLHPFPRIDSHVPYAIYAVTEYELDSLLTEIQNLEEKLSAQQTSSPSHHL